MSFDDPRTTVAATCRALAVYGLGSEIGGHVSVRDPGQDAYWINALDRTFEEMTPADVVQLDFDGNQLQGDRIVSLGADFHEGIYRHRDDVSAIVHSHGPWITALCALGRPVLPWHNLSTFFAGDECVMSEDDSFEAIAPSLGSASTILIPYHGAITVSDSLPRAAALHVTLEYAAELDVRITPTGAQPMPPEMVERMKELVTKAGYLDHTYALMLRKARRALAAAGETWLPEEAA